MRNVEIKNNASWSPLGMGDLHDSTLTFDHRNIEPVDGISLKSTFAQQYSVDSVTDSTSTYMLTNQVRVRDVLDIKLPGSRYPEQFTTSLLANAYPSITNNSAYIYIFEQSVQSSSRDHIVGNRSNELTVGEHVYPATDKQTYIWAQETTDNSIYYTVTLHDEQTASVNHNDNVNNVYMTIKKDNNGFVFIVFEESSTIQPEENQIFNYYINKDHGFIIFYKNVDGVTYYVTPKTDNGGALVAENIVDLTPLKFPQGSVIRYIPYKRNTTDHKLYNNWVSYKSTGDINNLVVNPTKSYQDVTNNYLVVSQFQNIQDNMLKSDLIQLKNQLTPTGNTNRNNPFPNLRDVDHREYDKIIISDHIESGTGLNLNYSSYETEISLDPDKITYFNTPQNMYPYEKININDCGLIEGGAIGGDTPLNSDKIFKKAASYKYNTPNGAPTDEDTGTWLCSWLKSNVGVDWNKSSHYKENIIVNYDKKVYKCIENNVGLKPPVNPDEWEEIDEPPPVWVDRYYNPEKFSTQQALEIEGQYTTYTTKFETIVQLLEADNKYVFDKTSDLTFEPGSLYAYYRIGEKQIDTIINANNHSKIHDGVGPVYDQGRSLQTDIDDEVTFFGDTYIETTTPSNITNSDFTVSFQMSRDDWSKPFAGQFLGNYTNQGVGVFNKQNLTPYIVLRSDNDVQIYNTNMDLIYSPPVTQTHSVVKLTGNEDIIMFDSVSATSYDMKGMLVESTVFKQQNDIINANIDNDYYYTLDNQNEVKRFNLYTEAEDQLNRAYPYNTVIGSTDHAATTDFTWEQSDNTFIQPIDNGKLQYRINCDYYTVDNDECVWFVKGNKVFRHALSNVLGVNATWTGVLGVEGVGEGQSDVLLVATENFEGFEGNKITLQGDGVKTLLTLINEWNEIESSNTVNLVRGNSSVVPASGADGYIRLSGGRNRGQSSITYSLSAENTINGIKCDYDNNLIVMYDDTKIIKMDNLRNVLYKADLFQLDPNLTGKTFSEVAFDIVTEVTQEHGYNTYAIVLARDGDDVFYIKIDFDTDSFVHRSTKQLSIPDVNLNKQFNITQFENYRHICKDTIHTNNLIFQFKYQSYFDTDKNKIKKLIVNTDDLSPGYHHFSFSFNSTNSNLSLFVDGELRDAQSSEDAASGAAYKYSRSIHDPIIVGAEPFFNNITFSERLLSQNYSFAKDFKIRKYRVYNEYLNFQKIKMLSREQQEVRSINLTLPTGKRNFIDSVDKFYKHRKPGFKSKQFNINITNDSLSSTDQQRYIAEQLRMSVNDVVPVNTFVDKINWIT